MTRILPAALALYAAIAALPALALDPVPAAQLWLRQKMLSVVRPDSSWEQVRDKMREAFDVTDIDQTGITQATIDKHRQIQLARQRAGLVSQKLAFDLDGDGVVTRDELAIALRREAEHQVRRTRPAAATAAEHERLIAEKLAAMIGAIMQDDADGDGRLTIAEITAAVDRQLAANEARAGASRGARPLPLDLVSPELDPDGDGVLTADEYDEAVRAAFDEIDTDRDGRLSLAELEAFARKLGDDARARGLAEEGRRREAELRDKREACGLPTLPPSGKLVLVGVYEGSGLANAALGPDDTEVDAGHLVIEPGPEPLHLVLTSYSAMIWIISGEVARVETVAASASTASGKIPRVGLIGIAPEKIRIVAASCIPDFHPGDDNARIAEESRTTVEALQALTGRRPDTLAGVHRLSTMHLPSGRHDDQAVLPFVTELPILSPGRAMWQAFLRHRPGGLVRIDPAKVVARLAPRPLEQLPGEAGIAQLIDEEALVVVAFSQTFRLGFSDKETVVMLTPTPDKFKITRKIRIPAGFTGKFVLGRGVPVPDGDLDRSCLVSEETGKTIGRKSC